MPVVLGCEGPVFLFFSWILVPYLIKLCAKTETTIVSNRFGHFIDASRTHEGEKTAQTFHIPYEFSFLFYEDGVTTMDLHYITWLLPLKCVTNRCSGCRVDLNVHISSWKVPRAVVIFMS